MDEAPASTRITYSLSKREERDAISLLLYGRKSTRVVYGFHILLTPPLLILIGANLVGSPSIVSGIVLLVLLSLCPAQYWYTYFTLTRSGEFGRECTYEFSPDRIQIETPGGVAPMLSVSWQSITRTYVCRNFLVHELSSGGKLFVPQRSFPVGDELTKFQQLLDSKLGWNARLPVRTYVAGSNP